MDRFKKSIGIAVCIGICMQCTYLEYENARGDVGGRILLPNQRGELLEDHSGATIVMDNGMEQYFNESGTDGRFVIEGIPAGTYNIEFSKKNFGSYHHYGMVYPGGPATFWFDPPVMLSQIPQVRIIQLDMEARRFMGMRIFDGRIQIGHNYTGSEHLQFRLFVHTHANVKFDNYSHSSVISGIGRDIQFSFSLAPEQMPNNGIFYFVLYPCILCDLSYRDIKTGREIYFNIEKEGSNVASARLP